MVKSFVHDHPLFHHVVALNSRGGHSHTRITCAIVGANMGANMVKIEEFHFSLVDPAVAVQYIGRTQLDKCCCL